MQAERAEIVDTQGTPFVAQSKERLVATTTMQAPASAMKKSIPAWTYGLVGFLLLGLAAGGWFFLFIVNPSVLAAAEAKLEIRLNQSGPKVGDVWRDPTTGMEFVWIPKGCFMMGSPSSEQGRSSREGPVHEVCVDGFWMGKYEVTQREWEHLMGNNPSRFKGSRNPVEMVSWNDAQSFIGKLNALGSGHFRLPTEAEWEYAARAGTQTAYHFGNSISHSQANYGRNLDRTQPVGSYPANAFGLHDMHGNVLEWCDDVYDANFYSRSPRNNPRSDGSGRRVLRGGSWDDDPQVVRSANRGRKNHGHRDNDVGFRVVGLLQDAP